MSRTNTWTRYDCQWDRAGHEPVVRRACPLSTACRALYTRYPLAAGHEGWLDLWTMLWHYWTLSGAASLCTSRSIFNEGPLAVSEHPLAMG
jgi:hypothetical protein